MATKRTTRKAPVKAGAALSPEIPDDYRQAILQAQRDTEAALTADPSRSLGDPSLPINQFAARDKLMVEKKRFEAGDKNALLGAVRICANFELVMPDWLSRAFIRAYDQVLNNNVGSWDDAFGRPLPKGKHLSAARKKRYKAPQVWLEVRRLQADGRGTDDLLFEDVGRMLGIGKTLVSEYYYAMDQQLKSSPFINVLLEGHIADSQEQLPEVSKVLRKARRKR